MAVHLKIRDYIGEGYIGVIQGLYRDNGKWKLLCRAGVGWIPHAYLGAGESGLGRGNTRTSNTRLLKSMWVRFVGACLRGVG